MIQDISNILEYRVPSKCVKKENSDGNPKENQPAHMAEEKSRTDDSNASSSNTVNFAGCFFNFSK